MNNKYLISLIVIILISLLVLGCKDIEIKSIWSEKNISIDGTDHEWSGSYTFVGDEKVAIGAQNDNDYLYLVFKTIDRQVKQKVIGNGLTIWIDPDGGEEKSFGIHYPVGMISWGNTQIYNPKDWGTPEEREKRLKEKSKLMLEEMAIISPYGRSEYGLSIKNPFGIEIALNDTSGALIYEMKIPIRSPESSMYSYLLTDDTKISIGIETGETDKKEMMAQRSGGGLSSGGGMGGGKGGGIMGKGSGKGGGKQSAMKNMLEPIKFRLSLTLSSGDKPIDKSDDK